VNTRSLRRLSSSGCSSLFEAY